MSDNSLSTGIVSLDKLLQGILDGDNIVWQVSTVDDYAPFLVPFCERALRDGRQVIYFRFARHAPLLEMQENISVCELDTAGGFESFISEIHAVIENAGREAVYVFDCLSDLALDWCSDRMLGNFFLLTCPYIHDHGAMAYFGLTQNAHSFHALKPVREISQIIINVRRYDNHLYIHPVKVEHRHSRTMYMLHRQENGQFKPVTQSAVIARILGTEFRTDSDAGNWRLGYWGRTFADAEDLLATEDSTLSPSSEQVAMEYKLRRMLIARDGRLLPLADRFLKLDDLLAIRRRMIGTGLIGGKAAGMVMARAILRDRDPDFHACLEPHDSFFIGSDVFYTFLVQNGLWWIKHQQKNPRVFLEGLELARHQILNGQFPDYIIAQFSSVLEYYGQSPIIVRSSSLLEDDFDNSFAGKSESILCTNQGSFDKRLNDFVSAVRRVYASTMSDTSLNYRAARGILDRDEQMAILVQRVSGTIHDTRFFPHIAGVGLSFNPYIWDDRVDPHAGVIRLVLGLGTRAVMPHPEDYTRVVALNAPELQIRNDNKNAPYSQQKADVLDLDSERVHSLEISTIVKDIDDFPLSLFASRDERIERVAKEQNLKNVFAWSLTFDTLLTETTFVERMRRALKTLETAYGTPVDIEFSANFENQNDYMINLLQCRPLHTQGISGDDDWDDTPIPDTRVLLQSGGPVLGQSRKIVIDRIIYVDPTVYSDMPIRDRYSVARLIGDLVRLDEHHRSQVMLIGPGRWGTADPALGVPVSFAELHGASVICEVAAMHSGLTPDISLGSHFFNELVETNILYFALSPGVREATLDDSFFTGTPNLLSQLMPEKAHWQGAVKVFQSRTHDSVQFVFRANTARQRAVLCLGTA